MSNGENSYSVYKHTTPSNKVYIGITRQRPERRWQNGYGYEKHGNIHWYNAIKKYGWNNIEHEILLSGLSEDEAKQKEIELIAFYDSTNRNNGYNISPGGGAVSRESVLKRQKTRNITGVTKRESERMLSVWANPQKRAKITVAMQGKTRTEEQKKHYKAANAYRIGKPLPDKTKEKISQIAKTRTGEKSSRAKKVYQIDPIDGSIVKTFYTARQAAIEIGAKSISAISNTCRGSGSKKQVCCGYYWCYEKDYETFMKHIELNPVFTKHGNISKNPRIMCIENGVIYQTVSEAANNLCIKEISSITQQIYGQRKTVHGYTFKFVDCKGKVIEKEKPKSTRTISKEHREAVSKAKSKPVMCIETGEIFKNSFEAIRFAGLKESSAAMIKRQIDGKIKTVKGYTWKYV